MQASLSSPGGICCAAIERIIFELCRGMARLLPSQVESRLWLSGSRTGPVLKQALETLFSATFSHESTRRRGKLAGFAVRR